MPLTLLRPRLCVYQHFINRYWLDFRQVTYSLRLESLSVTLFLCTFWRCAHKAHCDDIRQQNLTLAFKPNRDKRRRRRRKKLNYSSVNLVTCYAAERHIFFEIDSVLWWYKRMWVATILLMQYFQYNFRIYIFVCNNT